MATYSLYVAHTIGIIEGGIITTGKEEFAEVVRSLRSHGRACKWKSCVLNTASGFCEKRFRYGNNADIRFVFERIGFSPKMNELEAAVGTGYLDIYDDILERRRETLYYLIDKFEEFKPYLTTIKKEDHEETGPYALPIVVDTAASFNRSELTAHLEKTELISVLFLVLC